MDYAESTISEVLKGTYTRADNNPILRKLNGWVDDDERRRQRKRPLGFYPTSVFETIRALAQYAKSNARTPDSQRHPVAENDLPRIALGYGPAGSGKTIGAQALNAEDPLSIYIRIEQKSGTDAGIANLIIDAMGIRGAKRGQGAVRMMVEKLKDTGRLLIVDEAHRIKFSGLEFIRDLADVCGIPVLLLACQRRVEEGQRVNYFGMVEFFPRIKGVFTGPMDGFDPARHRVDMGANPGSELREAVLAGAKVEKVEAVKPSPNPIEYRDIGSDTTNDTVTVGNIGQLSGSRLKFDPAEADEGVYFVATAGGDTKVATVQKNKPSQLVFLVPSLVAGTYYLEVRARMGSGTSARQLRTGRLDSTLTVLPT